ncbi:MAG: tRNA lysidine(34) synthetase TilS [Rhodocyclaceae bacterium]
MAVTRNKPSTDLLDRVAAFLAPRLLQGRHVCVGLSGGRDSVALLHVLVRLRQQATAQASPFKLSALHVHHGLSARADDWAEFCESLCLSFDVPLRVARVTVSGIADEGLEAAARRARYAAFGACGADWLVLAHHRDDQAETLLLNLLRGAGTQGLAAMPEERTLRGGATRLLRPLLDISRKEIEHWLALHALVWVEDDSNADTYLRRNFLRSEIFPRLASVFHEPAAVLARASAHLHEQAGLADALAALDARDTVEADAILLPTFNALPPARRRNLLRYQLRRHGLRMPDSRFLAEIVRQLAEATPAAAPAFALDGAFLRVFRGRLNFCVNAAAACDPLRWQGEEALPWAGGEVRFEATEGAGLSRRRLAGAVVSLRLRQGGERLQLAATRPRRSLKKLLQEAAVPLWERRQLPLLWCGEHLVWVGGIGSDAAWAAAPGEPGVLPVWQLLARGPREVGDEAAGLLIETGKGIG